jgi:hypothetical protein
MTTESAEIIQLFAPRSKAGKTFPVRVLVSAERPESFKSPAKSHSANNSGNIFPASDTAENQRLRRHDGANMQTFLFRSYDLIVKSDEADLICDVSFDIDRAQSKLRRIKQRLQRIQEQSAAQIRLLTMAAAKLTAAIVAAKGEAPAESTGPVVSEPYHDLLEAFGKLDSAGRRAIVQYLKTQTND